METSLLQSRLQEIIKSLTNLNTVHINSYIEDFIEDFTGKPGAIWVLTITYLPKYETYSIEYFAWEISEDGPIPGIQLFPDENIYLETDMKTLLMNNFDYLQKLLQDPYLDTWTKEEQNKINALDFTQGIHYFIYEAYTSLIIPCPSKVNDMNIIYQDTHLVIYESEIGVLPLD